MHPLGEEYDHFLCVFLVGIVFVLSILAYILTQYLIEKAKQRYLEYLHSRWTDSAQIGDKCEKCE